MIALKNRWVYKPCIIGNDFLHLLLMGLKRGKKRCSIPRSMEKTTAACELPRKKKIEVLVTAAGFNNNNIMWRHHLAKQGKQQQQGLNKEYE